MISPKQRTVWYPDLKGVEPKLADAIRLVYDALYSMNGRAGKESVFESNINLAGNVVLGATNSKTPKDGELITKKYADANYHASVIVAQISAGGKNPLNLNNLLGQALEPQKAALPLGVLSDRPVTGIVDGELYRNTTSPSGIDRWNETTAAWDRVSDDSAAVAEAGTGNLLKVDGTTTLTGNRTVNAIWKFIQNVEIGDAAADTLKVTSTIISDLIFADNSYDIGKSGATRPRDIFLSRNLSAAGALTGNTATVSTLTQNAFIYPAAGGLLNSTTAATNGDLLIGSTGLPPVRAGLTAVANQTSITVGAGSITVGTVQDIGTGSVPAFSAVRLGATVALSGTVRLANTGTIKARNASNLADVEMIQVNASDNIAIGSGVVGDIQWGKALVALGGGVAPTLGTIGGSGPATAAQNTWLRLLDSTGAAAWVPVWK